MKTKSSITMIYIVALSLTIFSLLYFTHVQAATVLQPPPLLNAVTGARVYNTGAILKNNSAVPAAGVRVGFRIPSLFATENINQLSLSFGINDAVSDVIQLGNQFSSTFDEQYLFEDFMIAPGGTLKLAAMIESQKENALKFKKRSMKLTDAGQNELATLFYGGTIKAQENSPLNYTFGNDSFGTDATGNEFDISLSIDQITLGWSTSLVDITEVDIDNPSFLTSLGLNDLQIFNNSGSGWFLSGDQEISPITVPFVLPEGAFLVADIRGTADKNGANELPIHFLQQHEDLIVPVPASLWLFISGILSLFGVAQRSKKTNLESKC